MNKHNTVSPVKGKCEWLLVILDGLYDDKRSQSA